jgi:hypothetical protein
MKTKSLLKIIFLTGFSIVSVIVCAQTRPVIGDYTVYYGSLHNHCNVSSVGTGTPDQAY